MGIKHATQNQSELAHNRVCFLDANLHTVFVGAWRLTCSGLWYPESITHTPAPPPPPPSEIDG